MLYFLFLRTAPLVAIEVACQQGRIVVIGGVVALCVWWQAAKLLGCSEQIVCDLLHREVSDLSFDGQNPH